MTDLLDLPQLALSLLRRYMLDRAAANLPVNWYAGGARYTAEPNPSKYEGCWQVGGNRWSGNYDLDFVLREIEAADTFDLRG